MQALSEFMRWSLKNITKKQQEKNPFNVKSLLKRLYSLAHHPNPYKRLGFALTFSQLYAIFREEEALIDLFVLEILHNCVFSLRFAHADDASLGTGDKVAHVISLFAHLVTKKAALLCKANAKRRMHPDLDAFVEWVFKEIGRSETRCRTECMTLFNRFAPLLPACRSAAVWVQNKIRRDKLQSLLPVFEPADLRPPAANKFTVEELNVFLHGILTSLDCYTWVFTEVGLFCFIVFVFLMPTVLFLAELRRACDFHACHSGQHHRCLHGTERVSVALCAAEPRAFAAACRHPQRARAAQPRTHRSHSALVRLCARHARASPRLPHAREDNRRAAVRADLHFVAEPHRGRLWPD